VASHASALKAHRQSVKNNERNRQYRSRLRNALRDLFSCRRTIEGREGRSEANHFLIDKMTTKGIIH
jgi:ribosomal protein S20